MSVYMRLCVYMWKVTVREGNRAGRSRGLKWEIILSLTLELCQFLVEFFRRVCTVQVSGGGGGGEREKGGGEEDGQEEVEVVMRVDEEKGVNGKNERDK
ncbi:hypothetical protein PoB_006759200 [Plakobranchus ocellatus]|uniref:Uncharacterized protein n=1 Tax=Plakobranchus ocellatus TaxID=259542 RepID=A0AAV4DA10_9GAST|nr:hypothetical protein PoB_006759200 [Plakobranchus ocellatus]